MRKWVWGVAGLDGAGQGWAGGAGGAESEPACGLRLPMAGKVP
ncbi:hypothetical protein [Alicyclobacillus cycloheptanicus]|uniref:Uncharacterized protein n=1 Tax=Alicyclobacillus cycloheptanicus TaxID=1457 RepID=A0ABT9XGH6_9BACL|nr:hypothetical protein [Alicyclobacillus cycloheptanicus]MDQ0189401.1 hypothetical protein [Alicyclobacillus cycloheptanicus]